MGLIMNTKIYNVAITTFSYENGSETSCYTLTSESFEKDLFDLLKKEKGPRTIYVISGINDSGKYTVLREEKVWKGVERYCRENNLPVEYKAWGQLKGEGISLKNAKLDDYGGFGTSEPRAGDIVHGQEIKKIFKVYIDTDNDEIVDTDTGEVYNHIPLANALKYYSPKNFWKRLYKDGIDGEYFLCVHDEELVKDLKE